MQSTKSYIVLLALITFSIYLDFCPTKAETNAQPNYNFFTLVKNFAKHVSASKYLHSNLEEEIAPLNDLLQSSETPTIIDELIKPATNKCSEDLHYLYNNFKTEWGLKMLDSYAKPESGILTGNVKWLGEYDECLRVYAPPSGNLGDFHGKYCTLEVPISFRNTTMSLSMGICLPDSCHPNGYIYNISNFNSTDKFSSYGGSIYTLLNSTKVTCQEIRRELTTGAIAVICVMSLFAFLALIGSSITACKHYIKKRGTEIETGSKCSVASSAIAFNDNYEKSSLNGSDDRVRILIADKKSWPAWYGKCDRFFNCFCIFKNGEKILNTDDTEGQLPCLHGVRFLSMTWVIVCHSYGFGFNFVRNSAETITLIDHWLFQVILNGFYSVDSFFLLSGFLVSYVIFKMFAKSNEDKVQFPWLSFYIHRYIRLTPVYMIVLGFYTTLMAYLGSGPLWNLKDDPKCIANWWWNALYINNFQSAADQCMGWAWYLANDMQFYVISPLFLITLWWVPKIGFSLLAFAFIANFSSIFALTYVYNLIPGFGNIAEQVQNLTVFLDRWTNKFNKVYVRPYTRIGPYLVGIALAYIIIKRKEKNSGKLSLITLAFGWIVASGVTLTCLFGLYHRNPDTVASSFYSALNSTCFACGLAWVIFVCIIGQGGMVNRILSWKFWIPLSRLTFCAYLVHPMVQTVFYSSLRTTIQFSHITMVMYYFGLLTLSYMAALVTSLLFESPVIRLERLLLK